jgi:sarcosine oxidase, subunit beta
MANAYDVVVIGAGIMGASAAHFLIRKGVKRVLLVERGGPAAGGTGRSAAIVRSFYTVPVMARLAKEAVDLFHRLPEEIGVDGGFQATGFTQLVPPEWVATAEEKVAMQQELGIATGFVPRSEWEERFPWLDLDGIGAIVLEPRSGYADPVQTTEGFVARFTASGGEFRARTPVRVLLRQGDRITGVLTDHGPIAAGQVVNAAGPWAKPLAESVGIELPLRAVREQDAVWQVRAGRPLPTTPVSNPIEAVYMRPMGEQRWLLGRGYPKPYFDVDPYNFKETCDDDVVNDVYQRWTRRIPALDAARLVHGFAALYDATPDWIPFVGPRSGLEGYADASGGSGHAFKTGPIFARELVEWIIDGAVRDDFRQFSHDRMAGGTPFAQSFGGNRA